MHVFKLFRVSRHQMYEDIKGEIRSLFSCSIHQKPQIESEAVNRRKPDNTMTKRKGTKVQTKNYKTLHRKIKIEQREPVKTRGASMCLR